MQKDLIVEEFKEFIQAEHDMALMSIVSRAECLKELADLVYVAAQYAENMDWDLEQALRRVHRSNMSKSSVMTANLFTVKTVRFSKDLTINHLI